LNIVLNYFMIQNIGAIGAAKATFITQLFMLLVYGFACIVKYSIKLNLKTSLRVIFFIGFAYGIMHFLLIHYPEQNLKNLFFRSAFYIIAVMIIAVSLGIMDKQILKLNIKPFN
ncbi:MAG: polysaccharide biosynthesis C-terminal domain-containing protein, partial [Bacteroidetes bacterium]|nr:polysaccharide biosynthesis C-terminal domain-containing protein [Bacteroidota bacterium]